MPLRSRSGCWKIIQPQEAVKMGQIIIILVLGLILPIASYAQGIPDPDKVATKYRELAEQRREELIRQTACANKAYKEKIVKRDLASYINRCMDEVAKAQQAKSGAKSSVRPGGP
jgi:hypothetical protein